MKKNKVVLLLAITFVMLLIASCRPARTARVTKAQIQLMQYVLNMEDLPGSNWSIEGQGWEAYDGDDGYGITYIRDKHVFIIHSVAIYSTMERAQQALQEWENEWIKITNLSHWYLIFR